MLDQTRAQDSKNPSLSEQELERLLKWAFQKLLRDGMSRADAEELSNDAVLELVVSMGRSKDTIHNIKAYFAQIVRNKVSRYYKSLQRERTLQQELQQDIATQKGIAHQGYSLEPEPPALMELDEMFETFIKRLTDTQLEVLKGLVYGQTVTQIAHSRGVSQATVSEHVKNIEEIFGRILRRSLSKRSLHSIRTHSSFSLVERRLRFVFESIVATVLLCWTTAWSWAQKATRSITDKLQPKRSTLRTTGAMPHVLRSFLLPIVFTACMTCPTGDAQEPLPSTSIHTVAPAKPATLGQLSQQTKQFVRAAQRSNTTKLSVQEVRPQRLSQQQARLLHRKTSRSRTQTPPARWKQHKAQLQHHHRQTTSPAASPPPTLGRPPAPSPTVLQPARLPVAWIPPSPAAPSLPPAPMPTTKGCKAGAKRLCYGGPEGTQGRGSCQSGYQHCSDEGNWGPCLGQVLPQAERCDNIDNNCDGKVDEGLTHACSTACGEGQSVCMNGSWTTCDAPTPKKEVCDGKDNDCNGKIDETCLSFCVTQGGQAFLQSKGWIHTFKPGQKILSRQMYREDLCSLESHDDVFTQAKRKDGFVDQNTNLNTTKTPTKTLEKAPSLRLVRDYEGNFFIIDGTHQRILQWGMQAHNKKRLPFTTKLYTRKTPLEAPYNKTVRILTTDQTQPPGLGKSCGVTLHRIPYLDRLVPEKVFKATPLIQDPMEGMAISYNPDETSNE